MVEMIQEVPIWDILVFLHQRDYDLGGQILLLGLGRDLFHELGKDYQEDVCGGGNTV